MSRTGAGVRPMVLPYSPQKVKASMSDSLHCLSLFELKRKNFISRGKVRLLGQFEFTLKRMLLSE